MEARPLSARAALVLPGLLLRGLRYGSRFPQGAPQKLQHWIVSPPEVEFGDFARLGERRRGVRGESAEGHPQKESAER